MKTIYVIETNYEGRVIAIGASLSEEAVEKKLAELNMNNPGRTNDYWISEYKLTDDFTLFDIF